MKIKVGDIISVRVKVISKTEEEGNKFSYKIKALTNGYDSMRVSQEDIVATNMQVPTETEEV